MSFDASGSMKTLARETRIRFGATPDVLSGATMVGPGEALSPDAFLLSLPNGLRFHYQRGEGTICTRPSGIAEAEVALFHAGSVHGAIAWLNGMVPLHASAVMHQGAVAAFTGHSGAGKSTLAAALTQEGFPLFADDVLVLALSAEEALLAMPGHKRLKLWGDALALTGLTASESVRPAMDKYYVSPPLLEQNAPAPLTTLYFLDPPSEAPCAIQPIKGAERFNRVRSAFYRPHYGAALMSAAETFQRVTAIATRLSLYTIDRPRDRRLFSSNVTRVAGAVRDGSPVARMKAA